MSTRLLFARVRRAIEGTPGAVAASTMPPAVEGRPDVYRQIQSTVVEGSTLAVHPVTRSPCPEPIAFLDGTQRYEVVSYVGTSPVVAALIGAAVRLRVDGQFRTVAHDGGRLLIGAPNALAAFADRLPDFGRVELDLDGPVHPLEELEKAHRAVDDYRSALEWRVAAQFRRDDPSWLVVDGVLPHFDRLGSDPRVIGVSKSHATLPFDDPETSHLYLSLPQGHRTSVFRPATPHAAPVDSWALRLWAHEGKDLFHGLVRIEVAARTERAEHAERVSGWLLAERAPIARPDARWDRLLYGVAQVERHLRAR
ncbi:MAG: hypothetical protein KF785_11665 [Gemmatimonadales bacterium]|nr:hypothetical protein [Gemmatimonadales bacterium]